MTDPERIAEIRERQPVELFDYNQPQHDIRWLLDVLSEQFEIVRMLEPYHGKTNPAGQRAAIEYTIRFLSDRFKKARCDSEGSGECIRCNVMYLARVLQQMLDARARSLTKGEE